MSTKPATRTRRWEIRGWYGSTPPQGCQPKSVARKEVVVGDRRLNEALKRFEEDRTYERVTVTPL